MPTLIEVTLEEVNGGDEIVYTFQGQGAVSWSLRPVAEAIAHGGLGVQHVAGSTIIQVDLAGVGPSPENREADEPRRLANAGLGNVVEVVEMPLSGSVAQSFIGLRQNASNVEVHHRTDGEHAQLVVTIEGEHT
ncbi:AMIN-like domain-containing (lipo)protein [Rhodococcus xishaensis]|uniref:AMIN-like domain-containing protein n=1 Tax=Rhodococcus xishaensis TaxID=2487364 RepID=A0A438AVM3_9NOCA|nr:hypothetical protein [Rhodococcus xishaensis]RVW02768.1 hypothetical protein EGT50_08435 [Rhodococcus xishaensis]